nr:AAA family ATPase [Neobittarella massiliensis]
MTGLLAAIDPAALTYSEWIQVGMALKESGGSADDWDRWSQGDPARYRPGECMRKWRSFRGAPNPVTGGTLVRLAREQGWWPGASCRAGEVPAGTDVLEPGGATADSERRTADRQASEQRCRAGEVPGGTAVLEPGGVAADSEQRNEHGEFLPSRHWDPAAQLIEYLRALFEEGDRVGYVTESWERDGRYLPTKGRFDRTAGELCRALERCGGDIQSVLGRYRPQAGAWIRFNPLDGRGVKNENVAAYRYALVESDTQDLARQYAVIKALQLPVACLVYSGGKSLHAVVHIGAADARQYRQRVDELYRVCRENGLEVDRQNCNPSRLSRMPGAVRGGRRQWLVATHMGRADWDRWQAFMRRGDDGLPETETIASHWNDLPPLSPPLIEGLLRQGHKMLLAGPSKAGKSFALIQLCIAIAEGREWLGRRCARGRVLYVNLELDRASCLHRFYDVYAALGWAPQGLENIDVWNLRGHSVPLDQLVPRLIERSADRAYAAVVIDPIYKVITGDENAADQMAHFCNQFDSICTQLGCAAVYCHHHSKGAQGGKRAMDRASGSGVFARDPDALLDLIELGTGDALRRQLAAQLRRTALGEQLARCGWHGQEQDEEQLLQLAQGLLPPEEYRRLCSQLNRLQLAAQTATAWRIDATLREFAKPPPLDVWFAYPVHEADTTGVLAALQPWEVLPGRRTSSKIDRTQARQNTVEEAFAVCGREGRAAVRDMAAHLQVTERTVRNRLKEHGGFLVKDGQVRRRPIDR